jgi:hypothetical protein
MGPAPEKGKEDPDLIKAGKQPVTALPGAAYFHHADSFAMMRDGHLDICVLGAFQVSVSGDLAYGRGGGAMNLAIGAKPTFVMMEHLTKAGDSKIVPSCSYPLTARACGSRIYPDLAVIDVMTMGLVVRDKSRPRRWSRSMENHRIKDPAPIVAAHETGERRVASVALRLRAARRFKCGPYRHSKTRRGGSRPVIASTKSARSWHSQTRIRVRRADSQQPAGLPRPV